MSIRIGIYDFFAYTIPGAVYLSAIVYLLHTLHVVSVDPTSFSLSIPDIVILAVLSYISGLVLDPLPAPLWERLFGSKEVSEVALDEFKQDHPSLAINFGAKDWPILLAYIRLEDIDVASDIDKSNAMSKMFKNICFGFFIFSAISIIQVPRAGFWSVLLPLMFLLLSFLAGRQGTRFRRWFYLMIYEAIVASNLDISLLIGHLKRDGSGRDEVD
jgi:hypothetical protein